MIKKVEEIFRQFNVTMSEVCTVEYIRNRIPEDILLLPEYADPKLQNGRIACVRKAR